jgi:tetratricopeptide (TPR) repeat protein
VVALLVDLFSSADPEHLPGGRDLTIGEFLKNAERMLARQDVDAGVQARLRHALGKVYMARSQFQEARTHLGTALDRLRRSKGDEDPATAAVVHDLAKLAAQTGPKAEAAELLRQSLNLHRRIYGENHASVAQCMHDLADALDERAEKLTLIEGALALRRGLFGNGHISVAESLTALGVYHYEGGALDRAEREFEEAVEVARRAAPAGHPSTLWAMNDLAVVRHYLGRYEEAERLQRALLAEKRRIHGDETVPVAVVWGNLGTVLASMGNYGECEEAFRKARTLFVKLLGPEHVHVANATRNLARIRMFRGDYREASSLFRQALEVHRKVNGPDAGYWYMRGQAAVVDAGLGAATQAAKELRQILDHLSALGVPPLRQSDAQVALGFVLLETGKAGEAETSMRRALEARQKHLPPEHPAIAEAECGLGAVLAAQGKPEGGELLRRSLPRYKTWGLAVYASRAGAWM